MACAEPRPEPKLSMQAAGERAFDFHAAVDDDAVAVLVAGGGLIGVSKLSQPMPKPR